MTDNPLLEYERLRRRTPLRILWGVGVALGLVHVACATVIALEMYSDWDNHGFLRGIGSVLAILLSHVISAATDLLVIPPLLATCLTHERAAGTGEMLALTPLTPEAILWAKVRSRVEPLCWPACAQLVLLTPGVLLFEIWNRKESGMPGSPPLLAIASGLWSAAGFAASAAVSLWAGLKARRTSTALALAYAAVYLGAGGIWGLEAGAYFAAGECVPSVRADEVGGCAAFVTAALLAIAVLFASRWLWRRCAGMLDEALSGKE